MLFVRPPELLAPRMTCHWTCALRIGRQREVVEVSGRLAAPDRAPADPGRGVDDHIGVTWAPATPFSSLLLPSTLDRQPETAGPNVTPRPITPTVQCNTARRLSTRNFDHGRLLTRNTAKTAADDGGATSPGSQPARAARRQPEQAVGGPAAALHEQVAQHRERAQEEEHARAVGDAARDAVGTGPARPAVEGRQHGVGDRLPGIETAHHLSGLVDGRPERDDRGRCAGTGIRAARGSGSDRPCPPWGTPPGAAGRRLRWAGRGRGVARRRRPPQRRRPPCAWRKAPAARGPAPRSGRAGSAARPPAPAAPRRPAGAPVRPPLAGTPRRRRIHRVRA